MSRCATQPGAQLNTLPPRNTPNPTTDPPTILLVVYGFIFYSVLWWSWHVLETQLNRFAAYDVVHGCLNFIYLCGVVGMMINISQHKSVHGACELSPMHAHGFALSYAASRLAFVVRNMIDAYLLPHLKPILIQSGLTMFGNGVFIMAIWDFSDTSLFKLALGLIMCVEFVQVCLGPEYSQLCRNS